MSASPSLLDALSAFAARIGLIRPEDIAVPNSPQAEANGAEPYHEHERELPHQLLP